MKTLWRRRRVENSWEADPWDDPDVLYEFEGEAARGGHWPAKVLGYGFFVVLVAFLLTAGAIGLWAVKQINPGNPGAARNFTINVGDTPEAIAHRLKTQGIVTNERVFLEYTSRQGGLKIEPGYYTVRPHDTMGNIMLALNTPPAETFTKVTFPEGYTIAQMAARLEEKVPQLSAYSFIQSATVEAKVQSPYQPAGSTSLEGMLFPDTYQVAGNETAEQVVRVLEQQMERVAGKENIDDEARRASLVVGQTLTQYEVLIVASMIEKEAKVATDRPLIARVIYNRLLLGMPLQVDATLRYGQDSSTPFSELKALDTPYNSYLHTGLPPTPIANPSRASIAAALNPSPNPDPAGCKNQDTKKEPCLWLYYVLADKDGRHAFATNAADHERNVEAARVAPACSAEPPVRELTGYTNVVGVIGSPIAHSLSPTLHNAAFDAAGLDWCCVAFEVAEGDAARALGGMAALGIRGLSVTMPHKTEVAILVEDSTPEALALGAVNCVIRQPDGRLLGHNTDGAGFLDSLRVDASIDPHGMHVVVVGAGGAARAVVHALGTAGVASVVVINRNADRGARAAALAFGRGRVGTLADVETAELIVNATPVGMGAGATESPLPDQALHAGHVVVDLVYHPADTALIKAARAAGAITLGGLGMLVHQAAHAFTRWTGVEAPVEAMRAAARIHLGEAGT